MKFVDEKDLKDLGKEGIPHLVYDKNKMPDIASWRVFGPVLNKKKCIKCLTCWTLCPDTAIKRDAEDYPSFVGNACKGCLVCVKNCPTGALTAQKVRVRRKIC